VSQVKPSTSRTALVAELRYGRARWVSIYQQPRHWL